MKKKILRLIAVLFGIIVLAFHICWFYNYSLYTRFTDGLNELIKYTTFSILEDGYIYHVKFPSYPSFTGNLAVSTGDSLYSLIIWPSRFEDTEYGVMIPAENDTFMQIMIHRTLESEDVYDQPFVDSSKENIEDLFQKASVRWGTDFE